MASATDIKPPLTLEELVTIFRQEVDDLPGDVVTDVNWKNDDRGLLWKNQEAVRYANRAITEYCFRNPILDQDTTAAITQIAVTIGDNQYDFSEKILSIRRIKFVETTSGDEFIVRKRSVAWMDQYVPEWELETPTEGTIEFYIEDADHRVLTLYRAPEAAGTLHMIVDRLPSKYLSWSLRHLDKPEIDEFHHFDLVDYMVYQAYQKRDAETERPELAEAALDRFTANVGERPSARLLRVRRSERNYPRRARAQMF